MVSTFLFIAPEFSEMISLLPAQPFDLAVYIFFLHNPECLYVCMHLMKWTPALNSFCQNKNWLLFTELQDSSFVFVFFPCNGLTPLELPVASFFLAEHAAKQTKKTSLGKQQIRLAAVCKQVGFCGQTGVCKEVLRNPDSIVKQGKDKPFTSEALLVLGAVWAFSQKVFSPPHESTRQIGGETGCSWLLQTDRAGVWRVRGGHAHEAVWPGFAAGEKRVDWQEGW